MGFPNWTANELTIGLEWIFLTSLPLYTEIKYIRVQANLSKKEELKKS